MSDGRFVLDSGVAIEWFSPGREEDRLYAAGILRLMRESGALAFVPSHFHLEIAAFLMWRRKAKESEKRFSQEKVDRIMEELDSMEIRTVVSNESYRGLVKVAQRYHVQAKDVPFIHLAAEAGMPLATIDGGLKAAARSFKVGLVEFH